MTTITITIKEYSDLSGYSIRNVNQHLSKGNLLPYMRNIRKSGATWLLDVCKEWYESKTSGLITSKK